MKYWRWLWWIGMALLLSRCSTMQPTAPEEVFQDIPWVSMHEVVQKDDQLTDWIAALQESIGYYDHRPADTVYRFGSKKITAARLKTAYQALANIAKKGDREALFRHLENNFLLLRSMGSDGAGRVLVTGYYEPLLEGSLKKDKRFRYPIYKRPLDLVEQAVANGNENKKRIGRIVKGQLVPYYDHQEINQGQKLANRHLEIVWVDDQIDLFFLHIQGSGRIHLRDDTIMRVGYEVANGQPYRSIGKILLDEQQIPKEQISLSTIKQWLLDHPQEQDRILYANPSYVFFRQLTNEKGPLGNIALPLTPMRSIATDAQIFPKGAVAIVQTEIPAFNTKGEVIAWQNMVRFVVNQDTGGAIKGAGRVDLFMGFGLYAERVAGELKQPGALYFLLPVDPQNG